jgi:hypothetical protein
MAFPFHKSGIFIGKIVLSFETTATDKITARGKDDLAEQNRRPRAPIVDRTSGLKKAKQPKGGSIVWEPASTKDELSASNSPAKGQIHN